MTYSRGVKRRKEQATSEVKSASLLCKLLLYYDEVSQLVITRKGWECGNERVYVLRQATPTDLRVSISIPNAVKDLGDQSNLIVIE